MATIMLPDHVPPITAGRRRALAIALAGALLLPACASPGTYPSLARRDAERMSGSAVPVAPEAPPPGAVEAPAPTEGLAGRLAELERSARAAHRQFTAARSRTAALVYAARGAAMASESWSVATVALSDLEASRSNAMIALAELDSLHVADAIARFDRPGADAAAIATARDAVMALIGEEDAVLADLRGRLAR